MKVMKFGGTSVGKPERMHEVAKLITADPEKKIVVLSALSGTTNALVEIGQSAAHFEREKAGEQISKLDKHYHEFIEQLLETEKAAKRRWRSSANISNSSASFSVFRLVKP